jgi:hypothetical protein
MVSGFNTVTRTVENGNELVLVNATWSADVFTESGGLPDAFVGHLSLPGTMHFTYLGRDPGVNPLGTFVTVVDDFGFVGMLNGNTFEIKQDPSRTSSGFTTILQVNDVPPINYVVSSSLDVFGLFSFNGSPFMPGPPRTAVLQPIPEPGFGALAGSILIGIMGIASLRRRKVSRLRRS